MPALQVHGATLNYQTAGDGPPLVLIHGSATDLTTWDGVIGELARDHRVIVYDRRGYGQTRHRPVRDHRVHARDLTAVLQQIAGAPAAAVGWSSGGNIALAAAAAHPELFSALVIVEAPFHGMRHADRHVLATAAMLKLTQLRGRRLEAAEVFYRFGSTLRSGGPGYGIRLCNVRCRPASRRGPARSRTASTRRWSEGLRLTVDRCRNPRQGRALRMSANQQCVCGGGPGKRPGSPGHWYAIAVTSMPVTRGVS